MLINQIKGFPKGKEVPKPYKTHEGHISDSDMVNALGFNQARAEIGELDITLDVEKVKQIIQKSKLWFEFYVSIDKYPKQQIDILNELAQAIVREFNEGRLG